jgi:hypothetical protein
MFTRQSISLLAISALIALPAGIATAGDVDIQTNNARVILDRDGGVIINSTPTGTTILPQNLPISTVGVQRNQRLRTLRFPKRTLILQCRNRVYTHNSTQDNSFGTTINRTYSSTKTTTCQ